MLDRDRILLVHEYGRVDNALVFAMATQQLVDFSGFEQEILHALKTRGN